MINDARAVRFSNEVVRVMAEKVRDLKIDIDLTMQQWFVGINTLFPNSIEETLVDGREGASILTGADVNNLITQLAAIQTLLDQSGVKDIVAKPCVRFLSK